MVRASLDANHDHGTYARRKGERRQADAVLRERLERVERLLADSIEADRAAWTTPSARVCDALADIRSILADTRKDGKA